MFCGEKNPFITSKCWGVRIVVRGLSLSPWSSVKNGNGSTSTVLSCLARNVSSSF